MRGNAPPGVYWRNRSETCIPAGVLWLLLRNGVEYYDPKFVAAVTPLKPGWLRFPAGTGSMAYDWNPPGRRGRPYQHSLDELPDRWQPTSGSRATREYSRSLAAAHAGKRRRLALGFRHVREYSRRRDSHLLQWLYRYESRQRDADGAGGPGPGIECGGVGTGQRGISLSAHLSDRGGLRYGHVRPLFHGYCIRLASRHYRPVSGRSFSGKRQQLLGLGQRAVVLYAAWRTVRANTSVPMWIRSRAPIRRSLSRN